MLPLARRSQLLIFIVYVAGSAVRGQETRKGARERERVKEVGAGNRVHAIMKMKEERWG